MSTDIKNRMSQSLRRAAAWTGAVALLATSFLPLTASAVGQITVRSATLGSSAISIATTYAFSFKVATTGTVKAIKFQVCTSPLEQTSCTTPSGASASSVSGTIGQTGDISGFALGTSGLAPTANTVWIVNGTGVTANSANTQTVTLSNITNPSTANASFYTRITTYSDATATTEVDYGAEALSTANQVTVSANVQESLTFCVGTSGTGCSGGGLTGSTVNLGTGTDNVLSTSTPSGGTSLMAADTNATSGYAITYITTSPGGTGGTTCAGSLSSSNDCITDFGSSAGTFTAGTAKFGINLRDNVTPNVGTDISGSGSGAVSSPYNTVDSYAFQGGLTPRTVATSSGPTLSNLYTVAYAAQAGNTTKPGAYSAVFTWVCTGTF